MHALRTDFRVDPKRNAMAVGRDFPARGLRLLLEAAQPSVRSAAQKLEAFSRRAPDKTRRDVECCQVNLNLDMPPS